MSPQAGDFGVLLLAKRNWRTEFVISAISWVTRSPAYHAIQVVQAGGAIKIVEAEPQGVIVSPIDKYTNVAWSSLTLSAQQRFEMNQYALAQVGRKYGFYDDALLGITRLDRIKGPGFLWKLLSGKHSPVECAQLVDAVQLAGSVHLFDDSRRTGDVTPGDLYQVIQHGRVTS